MTEKIIHMETLLREYEFVSTGIYRGKADHNLYDVMFDNGLAYAKKRAETI